MSSLPPPLERIRERYHLEALRPVCAGLSRARQRLVIAGEVICTDEVLVEEACYASLDEMDAEINNLSIKIGQFSPFVTTSIPPPKYCYRDARRLTAWFISPVPVTSLATLLDELNVLFPCRYNHNRFLLAADMARFARAALQRAWARRRTPLRALRLLVTTLRSTTPQHLAFRERARLAAHVTAALALKHEAGLMHNNITEHTVFFSDALSPRFLNNYSGVTSTGLRELLPRPVQEHGEHSPFGEHSEDTYAAAVLVYRILTGQSPPTTEFTLDPQPCITPPPLLCKQFSARAEALNEMIALAQRCWTAAALVLDRMGATLNPQRFVYRRLLCRCSGSFLRSLPMVGPILNVWFPSRMAQTLLAVLDAETGTRVFSKARRHNKGCAGATLNWLRAPLGHATVRRGSRLARAIQAVIDHHTGRSLQTFDHEDLSRSAYRVSLVSSLSHQLVTVLFLVVVMLTTTNHSLESRQPAGVHHTTTAPQTLEMVPQQAPAAAPAPLQKTTPPASTKETPPATDTLTAPVTPSTTSTVPDDTRNPRTLGSCNPQLFPLKGEARVYRIESENEHCDFASLELTGERSAEKSIGALIGDHGTIFVMQRIATGYGTVRAARKALRTRDGYIAGRFYEAIGYRGLGERIVVAEGDLVSLNAFALWRIRRQPGA